jgi:quinoprotein glucose dehydrogenase
MISLDEETGLVFIPVGQPADNYVGTDRPGNNLYSDSILALEASTGKYRWHYQMVHHDLWDFDTNAPASLVDLTVKGKQVPALMEVTKMGLMFILNRRTGKPVFGAVERPVPQSTIPGEHTAPTQPFPIKPPPLGRLGVSRADISTITPDVQRFCTDSWIAWVSGCASILPPHWRLHCSTALKCAVRGGIWGAFLSSPAVNFRQSSPTWHYVSVHLMAGPRRRIGVHKGAIGRRGFHQMARSGMPAFSHLGAMVAVNGIGRD